jgi:hypothetical protein
VVLEALELAGDQRTDGLRYLPAVVGEIAQVLPRLEQDGDAVAIDKLMIAISRLCLC